MTNEERKGLAPLWTASTIGFNAQEIPIIAQLQHGVDRAGVGPWLQWASLVADPGLLFVFYVPLVLGVRLASGVRFLGAVILAEWLNQILKWWLFGDRPYWWVHEHDITLKAAAATRHASGLRQNPLTCETGPGNPSGHVMDSLVLGYVLADVLSTHVIKPLVAKRSVVLNLMLCRLCWNAFYFLLAIITASRVYNLNHFPHQCVVALAFGLLSVRIAYNDERWPLVSSCGKAVSVAVGLTATAFLTRAMLLLFGLNPDWSLEKASRWCDRPQWIHVDTTPFYTLVRYSGSALGLALALSLRRRLDANCDDLEEEDEDDGRAAPKEQLARAALGVALGLSVLYAHKTLMKELSASAPGLFYLAEFALNMLLVFATVVVVPWMCRVERPHSKSQ